MKRNYLVLAYFQAKKLFKGQMFIDAFPVTLCFGQQSLNIPISKLALLHFVSFGAPWF
jgi:hypothetical protein